MFDKAKKSSKTPKLSLKIHKAGMEQRMAPTVTGAGGGNTKGSNTGL